MKNVLVVGATGFVGKRLVERLLKENVDITVLARDISKVPRHWNVKARFGEITDSSSLKGVGHGIDTVFHLAAKVHDFSPTGNSEDEHQSVNVNGLRNILNECAPGTHVVYVSSVKAMAEDFSDFMNEESPVNPLSPYGRSKRDAELVLQQYSDKKLVKGTVLRLPLVYGPGGKGNVEKMISAIDKGFFVQIGEGKSLRSMVHVDNAVTACLSAAARPARNFRTYIVTDRRNYTVEELCQQISDSLGKRKPIKIPTTVAKAIARIGDHTQVLTGKRIPLNSDVLNKLVNTYTFDSQKISEELGYKPELSLEDSMKHIVEHWRDAQG